MYFLLYEMFNVRFLKISRYANYFADIGFSMIRNQKHFKMSIAPYKASL